MKQFLFLLIISIHAITSCSQGNTQKEKKEIKVGGGCEGCEVIYESPIPFEKLNWIDTLPDFNEAGKKLIVSGTVDKPDGKRAKDIIIYIYHTDQKGNYDNRNNEKGFAGRNGYIKGWMKTNEKGQYKFLTLKPVSYPNSNIPAHIHPIIKEPHTSDYWIDEFVFDDDPFLTSQELKNHKQRGGSGVLHTEEVNGVLYAERNIYLGKNIPGYPTSKTKEFSPAWLLAIIVLHLIHCIYLVLIKTKQFVLCANMVMGTV